MSPLTKRNGAVLSVVKLIKQVLLETTVLSVPMQSTFSYVKVKSFCLISILYPIIGEPFVTGSFQVTETLSFALAVVIVVGESGINAHSNVSTLELVE